jgi:hypothetical protein
VDEVEIDALEAETLERGVGAADRLVVAVVAARDLRRHDELVADAAAAHRLADLGLVLVVHGRVEQAIARADGRLDRGDTVLALQLVGAEPSSGKDVPSLSATVGIMTMPPRYARRTLTVRSAPR